VLKCKKPLLFLYFKELINLDLHFIIFNQLQSVSIWSEFCDEPYDFLNTKKPTEPYVQKSTYNICEAIQVRFEFKKCFKTTANLLILAPTQFQLPGLFFFLLTTNFSCIYRSVCLIILLSSSLETRLTAM
jgi:hypothetical protein